MKILLLQITHNEKSSGGKVITERNERLLKKYFGRENVLVSDELGLEYGYFEFDYEKKVKAIIDQYDIDLVFLDTSMLGVFSKAFYQDNIVFCFFHNIEAIYNQQKDNLTFREKIQDIIVNYSEKQNAQNACKLISICGRDSELMKKTYGRGADYILTSSMKDKLGDAATPANKATGDYLLFIGTDFFGNTDGLFPFIEEVMPQVDCRLIVAGTGMEKYANKYGPEYKTTFMGYVDDLGELYQNAKAVVLPIISGSGMKTKTCEALMYGKKIFGTGEAFSGFDHLGEDCRLCRDNEEFIAEINNFLQSDCGSFSEDNRRTFLEHYSDNAVEKEFFEFMDRSLNELTNSGFAGPGESEFHPVKKAAAEAPVVSVIMPVYNTREYLRKSIDSVLNQTFKSLELIIVDDESTDGCRELELELANKDSRISVYAQKHSGQGVARNNAMKMARGKYLYFLDSDDSIALNALEILTNKAEESNADVIYFSGSDIHVINGKYPAAMSGRAFYVMANKHLDYFASPCLYFLKAEFCKEKQLTFDELVYYEDCIFTFSSIMQADRVSVLNDVLFFRTLRRDSTTNAKPTVNHIKGMLRYNKYLEEFINQNELTPLERRMVLDDIQTTLHLALRKMKALSRLEQKCVDLPSDLNIHKTNKDYYIRRLQIHLLGPASGIGAK